VWTKLWNIVRDHIVEVATKEKRVAIYTVDSLKQLNIKFL
jgi:brefeldin A-inhibited guanine nucleotide-exchange protein